MTDTNQPTLADRAAEINRLYEGVDRADGAAKRKRIEVGNALIEARKHVPAGEWNAWCKANIPRSRQDIARVMKMAGAEDPDAALEAERTAARDGMQRSRDVTNVSYVAAPVETPPPAVLAEGGFFGPEPTPVEPVAEPAQRVSEFVVTGAAAEPEGAPATDAEVMNGVEMALSIFDKADPLFDLFLRLDREEQAKLYALVIGAFMPESPPAAVEQPKASHKRPAGELLNVQSKLLLAEFVVALDGATKENPAWGLTHDGWTAIQMLLGVVAHNEKAKAATVELEPVEVEVAPVEVEVVTGIEVEPIKVEVVEVIADAEPSWPAGMSPEECARAMIEKMNPPNPVLDLAKRFIADHEPAPVEVEVVAGIEPPAEPVLNRAAPWTYQLKETAPAEPKSGEKTIAFLDRMAAKAEAAKPEPKLEFEVVKPAPRNSRSKIGEQRRATPESIAAYAAANGYGVAA